jgi:hypothetical protein
VVASERIPNAADDNDRGRGRLPDTSPQPMHSLRNVRLKFSICLFRHFPQLNVAHAHRTRDYVIAAFTFFSVVVCLSLEVNASFERQYILGGIAFVSLNDVAR